MSFANQKPTEFANKSTNISTAEAQTRADSMKANASSTSQFQKAEINDGKEQMGSSQWKGNAKKLHNQVDYDLSAAGSWAARQGNSTGRKL